MAVGRACLDQCLIVSHHADRPLYKLGLQPIPRHAILSTVDANNCCW